MPLRQKMSGPCLEKSPASRQSEEAAPASRHAVKAEKVTVDPGKFGAEVGKKLT